MLIYIKGERERERERNREGDREGRMQSGNTNLWGKLRTVDHLLKVACFVRKANYTFNLKKEFI
jgi:hypothetical protein